MERNIGFLCIAVVIAMVIQGCAFFAPTRPAIKYEDIHAHSGIISLTQEYVFRDEFRMILNNLIVNYWDASGNWKGDIQGDATVFASMLLFRLSADTQDEAMEAMALRTVSHEAALVRKFFIKPVLSMDMVVGFPSLAQRYQYTGEESFRFVFLTGTHTANLLMLIRPGAFESFVHDRVCSYGIMSYMCFLAEDIAIANLEKQSLRNKGTALIEKANRHCRNQETGLYEYSHNLDWPQTTMMMALIAAYKATHDHAYLDWCLEVLTAMDALCRDTSRGGYFGHPDLQTKGLSGNNTMVWVLLDLYEATGDLRYLGKAHDTLAWILSDDLYDSGKHVIYHHWNTNGARADYFCTGCNFHTLVNIYRYNRLCERETHAAGSLNEAE